MNRFFKAAATVLILLFAATLFSLPTSAQSQAPSSTTSPQPKPVTADEGWHADVTPYIWFAGMHGTVGALGHDTSVHASFGDIFKYFNIGLMGAAEVRYNRVIMPVDFLWMKLSDDKGVPLNEAGVQSIKAKITETMLNPKIGYRLVSKERVKVDGLFGIRYWHVSTDLTLQPNQPLGGFSQSVNWVDALGGGKIEMALTPKVSVTVLGDAGAGAANWDYQVAGLLGYRVSRRWVLLAGYRYLSVNYRPSGNNQFVFDTNMPGLALGATFNIK